MDVDRVPVDVKASKHRAVRFIPRVSHYLKPTEGMYVKVPVFTSVLGGTSTISIEEVHPSTLAFKLMDKVVVLCRKHQFW